MLDTNVVISAVVSPHGSCARLVHAVANKYLQIFVAEEILAEYRSVLGRPGIVRRHQLTEEEIDRFVELLRSRGETVKLPALIPRVSRDPDDDMFVACAIAGNADFIVSGDIHLLEHGSFGEIQVLRPHEALALL